MAKLILMVGNIGTGKTNTAGNLMVDAAHVNNRNIMVVSDDDLALILNNGYYGHDIWTDKHWLLYSKIKATCARLILEAGFDVIIDSTNMSKEKRKKFIEIANEFNAIIIVYLHENAKEGLERRLAEPRGADLEVWHQVHERFENEYEEPSLDEGINEIIEIKGITNV